MLSGRLSSGNEMYSDINLLPVKSKGRATSNVGRPTTTTGNIDVKVDVFESSGQLDPCVVHGRLGVAHESVDVNNCLETLVALAFVKIFPIHLIAIKANTTFAIPVTTSLWLVEFTEIPSSFPQLLLWVRDCGR